MMDKADDDILKDEDPIISGTDDMNSSGIIDTHVHFWKYNKKRDAWMDDMKVLQQDYVPEKFIQTAKRNGVTGIVAVQADQSEVETHFLVELANTHSFIKGVVGWVDLRSSNLKDRLDYFSQYSVIKGYRHIVQGEGDDFLLNADFLAGVRSLAAYNYTYDILIFPRQLPAAFDFAQRLPDQKLIIDHCAKPIIRDKEITEWKKWMQEMARLPNVYCKLSGLLTEANWSAWRPADFYPYLDVVFESFGIERLIFGSDWPVILVAGMYVQWKSLLEKYMEKFSAEDREKVFYRNAGMFYNLI